MKKEKAIYTQAGYFCTACGNHTKTYNGAKPDKCPHCDATGTLKMEWNQQLEIEATVTPLPIE